MIARSPTCHDHAILFSGVASGFGLAGRTLLQEGTAGTLTVVTTEVDDLVQDVYHDGTPVAV